MCRQIVSKRKPFVGVLRIDKTYGTSDGVSGLDPGGGMLIKVGCGACAIVKNGPEVEMKKRRVVSVEDGRLRR